jgi:DNA polymerase-3 subunit beta
VAADPAAAASITLPQKQLRHLFGMVHFAMAQQDIRYYLNGLLMVVDGGEVKVVATDGHRLAYCAAKIGGNLGHHEVIVPRKTVLELQRLLADSDDPVTVDLSSNRIRFVFGEVELLSKLVEGKFPDYNRVIPQNYRKSLELPRETWAGALQRASILTSEKFKGVRFTLESGTLKVQSSNAEQEEAVEELDVDYAGEPLDIGFNVTYLLDVIANLKTDTVRLQLGDANSSALISVPDDDSFKYVVMPMRI